MKKGYKKLFIFELILIILLVLNNFFPNILGVYFIPVFLVITLILFSIFFGFEKDRHRYTKDIIIEILITLLIAFIAFYLLGIIIGFTKVKNYYTITNFFKFIFPLVLTIILKEFLRYNVMNKSEGCKLLYVVDTIFFVLIDIIVPLRYLTVKSKYNVFIFLALTLLPAISNDIACGYITRKVGYKPVIVYLLIFELYRYTIPIIPNPNEYILSIFNLLLPLIVAYRVYLFFKKDIDKELMVKKEKSNIGLVICLLLFTFGIVYFTSGYFHFHAIAVATGSMSPQIHKGDVVVIEKLNNNFDKLKVGDVIAFKYNGVTIVHRLVDIVQYDKNTKYFYTKGDANTDMDNWIIKENMIEGIVNYKIPYVGLPTVWLNEL